LPSSTPSARRLAITQLIGTPPTSGRLGRQLETNTPGPSGLRPAGPSRTQAIVELVEAGKLSVRVARSFPLDPGGRRPAATARDKAAGKNRAHGRLSRNVSSSLRWIRTDRVNAPGERRPGRCVRLFGNYRTGIPIMTWNRPPPRRQSAPFASRPVLRRQPVALTIALDPGAEQLAGTGGDPEVVARRRHPSTSKQLGWNTELTSPRWVVTRTGAPQSHRRQGPSCTRVRDLRAALRSASKASRFDRR